MRHEDLLAAVGHTLLVRLLSDDAPEVMARAKLELQNLFAMKDRVARQVILDARERRAGNRRLIVESSSGTMALGLRWSAPRHPVHIVTDPRIDPITLSKLDAYVSAHRGGDDEPGGESARLERLRPGCPARLSHANTPIRATHWPIGRSRPS